jgi:hypothetical protein
MDKLLHPATHHILMIVMAGDKTIAALQWEILALDYTATI